MILSSKHVNLVESEGMINDAKPDIIFHMMILDCW